jgi:hypothetical protein
MKIRNILLAAMAVMLFSSLNVFAGEEAEKEEVKRYYPLTKCFVSGEDLDEYAIVFEVDGREVRTCCKSCQKKVKADSDEYMKKLDEAIIKQQDKDYPLTKCPISEGELGSMGEPKKIVVDNYLVKLCCPGCEKSIRKDPDATLDKLSAYWQKKAGEESGEHAEAMETAEAHMEGHEGHEH